jgi:hypothetical protein
MLSQISSLRTKFPTYKSYAGAKLTDLFSAENLKTASVLSASELRTIFFRNTGSRFEKYILPAEAQFAPVHAIVILDYNMDGNQDFILAGNRNAMCVRLGVMDANYGQLFEGDGKGGFRYIPQNVSGLNLTGDVRSLKIMTIRGISYIFAGISNRGIVAYKINQQ